MEGLGRTLGQVHEGGWGLRARGYLERWILKVGRVREVGDLWFYGASTRV
jgi:hypothetical protein